MYALAKRKQVPLLTYSQAMLIGVTEGPPALRWLQHLIRLGFDYVVICVQ